jgi:hypothetical protein
VLLLDAGHAMLGTHDELLLRSDLYRDLVGHCDALPPRPSAGLRASTTLRPRRADVLPR